MNPDLGPRTWQFERLSLAKPAGHWLHVLEAGRKGQPCLLFIHGAAGSWHNFRLQIEWLQHSYRIIALDLRGHGLSPWPGTSRVEDFADDVMQLIQSKIPESVALVGHSFGGCLAAILASRLPGKVKGVALLNTAGQIPQGPVYRFLKIFARFSHWVAQVEPYWISCHGSVAHHLLWETLPQWNIWNLFPQISVPALVVAGKRDVLVPWRSCLRMASSLPDCQYRLIPDGQHVCMWEHSHILKDELEGWLARISWA